MEFFLEILLTVVVALLLSFPLAKLVSAATSGNVGGNDSTSDQSYNSEIGVVDCSVTDFGMKMDAPVLRSERNFRIVDESVEPVDRFVKEADRVGRVEEGTKGEPPSVVLTSEAESTAAVSLENMIAAEDIILDEPRDSAGEINGEFGGEREELLVRTIESESMAAASPENVIVKKMIVDERRDSAGGISGEFGPEREELMVRTIEAESATSVSLENVVAEERIIQGQKELSDSTGRRSDRLEDEESGDVLLRKSKEVSVEESTNTVEESEIKLERNVEEEKEDEESGDVLLGKSEDARVEESNNTVEESENKMERNVEEEKEEKHELIIEEDDDDDWEGIERSELEKAFAATAKRFEESGKAEEISPEAKMELYGLHKIATEGSCREAQPMAVMVTARSKWNAWQKLGNMSQEEAMEQYLALISKEIPGFFMTSGHTVGKMPEMETSVALPPNSVSVEDPITEETTGVESSKNVSETR